MPVGHCLDQNFDLQERIISFKERRLHTLEVELTDKCNLRCFYCYREAGYKGRFFSLEKAKEILEQAKDYGIRQMTWLGGEPTLNPEWAKIVRYSKNLGLRNELWSNGTTLNEKNVKRIINLCDIFVLHIDTINADSFFQVQQGKRRTKSEHHEILGGFDRLLERGFSPENVRLNIVLTRRILPSLEDTLRYFIIGKGIQTATLIPLYAIGRGACVAIGEFLDKIKLEKAFQKRAEIEDRPELMLIGTSEFCKHYQLTTAYITVEGNVLPYAGIKVPVGNIYQKNLSAILEESFETLSFASVVSFDGARNYINGPCGSCKNSAYCFGTRANSFFTSGKLDESDPTCWLV